MATVKRHTPEARAKRRAEVRRWRQKNIAHVKAYRQRYNKENRHSIAAWSKQYNKARYQANPDIYRENALLRDYGISLEQYDAMLEQQAGLCAICHEPNRDDRRFAVDHDHKTNKVRGLLCIKCNRGLGLFADNKVTLASALLYLAVAEESDET